ncbi:phosphonate metabolism transcriptional regulator PhnF [Arenibaculum pallidiluteum]|uniref:phosphonate metabolism transcriptional regulator PhnF n=1 Tax=Arenibaculum pallidiluteum TaxID=2812559 RepID=UPI001A961997|nr:phosphonate metabolism transcriptional regulator PhnF [Arenibaculum pallidiluteum]
MGIGRGSGVALWRQIAETLEADIAQQVFPPGGRLPTEEELAARFGVNRHTLRRAVAQLQDQGLVRVEQGRGTFVQEGVIDYPLGRRTRFSEIIRRQSRSASGHALRTAHVPADSAVAKALGIVPGEMVALVETLSSVDGAPLSLAMHHFPASRFPDLLEVYGTEGGITATLTRLGVGDYTRKVTRVTARLPDAYEMHHLRLSRTTPVLVSEAVNVDGRGRPVEYGVSRFAANRVQIVFES